MLLQFKDMDCLSVAGGTQELGIHAEGQWTDANISDTHTQRQTTDGKGQKSQYCVNIFIENKKYKHASLQQRLMFWK